MCLHHMIKIISKFKNVGVTHSVICRTSESQNTFTVGYYILRQSTILPKGFMHFLQYYDKKFPICGLCN